MLKFMTLGRVKAWIDLLSLLDVFQLGGNLATNLFSGLYPTWVGMVCSSPSS